MYYNGNNKYRVSTFMREVHNIVALKYENLSNEDIIQAKKLQDFFREIKKAAQNDGGIIENEMIQTIIDSINLPNGELLKNLFKGRGRQGGFRFERELTAIIEAVYKNITDEDIDIGQINIGAQRVDELKNLDDKMSQKILKEVGTKTLRKIQEEEKKAKKKYKYYISSVDGKIDVRGYSVDVKADASTDLLEIYNILKDATFSAKNYDSMTWDQKAKQFIEMQNHKVITLGKTNVYRSIVGTLNELGFDQRTAESALWAGLNKIKDGDNEVANHFYHLRYIYELTGSGLTYNGQSYGGVRFLIYNDPSGEIYVKAASEILVDVLEQQVELSQAMSTITIPKSKFLK